MKGKTPVRIALTKVKGVGFVTSNSIIKLMKLDPNKQIGMFEDDELTKLEDFLREPKGLPKWAVNRKFDPRSGKDEHLIASDLMIREKEDLDYLKKRKAYRGMRHAFGLRVRGQRTKSSGRRSGKALGVHRKKGMKPAGGKQ